MSVTAGRVTDHVTVGTAVQITAAAVLPQEGVEGGVTDQTAQSVSLTW